MKAFCQRQGWDAAFLERRRNIPIWHFPDRWSGPVNFVPHPPSLHPPVLFRLTCIKAQLYIAQPWPRSRVEIVEVLSHISVVLPGASLAMSISWREYVPPFTGVSEYWLILESPPHYLKKHSLICCSLFSVAVDYSPSPKARSSTVEKEVTSRILQRKSPWQGARVYRNWREPGDWEPGRLLLRLPVYFQTSIIRRLCRLVS